MSQVARMATVIRFALHPDDEFRHVSKQVITFFLADQHEFYGLTKEVANQVRELMDSPMMDDSILQFLFFGLLANNDSMQKDFTKTEGTRFEPLDVNQMAILVKELGKIYKSVAQLQFSKMSQALAQIKTQAMACNKKSIS